jgi:hypothetical protein
MDDDDDLIAAEEQLLQEGFDGARAETLTDVERQALLAALAEQRAAAQRQRGEVLAALASTLTAKRQEYINGRAALGVELEWWEDEEAYEGVDDANRGEEARYRTRKPPSGGGSPVPPAGVQFRSTVLLNITAPYVDTAAGRVADMLLPTDDRAWAVDATPLSDEATQVGAQQAELQAGQPVVQTERARQLDAAKTEAKRKAKNTQDKIDDWLTECNVHKSQRRLLHDAARVGTGVLKGPFPVMRKRRRGGDVLLEVVPATKRVSVWDCFPDPGCGENIQDGEGFFERDRMSPRGLGKLRGQQGYFDDQIEECLREGPAMHTMEGRIDLPRDVNIDKRQFEIWYFYGVLNREEVEALGCDCSTVTEGEIFVPIMATLVNDRVIRVALNPLDDGSFPYDFLPWSPREGLCYGKSLSRKIRPAQRIITGGCRNMLDNAGLGALILVLRRAGLRPVDNKWEIGGTGVKMFTIDDESSTKQAEHAIHAVEIPIRQAELMAIIQFGIKIAEDITGMPLLLQGQRGKTTDVLGIAEMMNNNANGVLRAHAKAMDDHVTEPHIARYVSWIGIYHADDPELNGDVVVDARGSSALVERELQNRWIAQMGAMVKDPDFKINPAKWFEEFSKSVRFDPKRIQYTDEEWEQKLAQPQPQAYQIQVAQINAEVKALVAKLEAEAAEKRTLLELLFREDLSASELKARVLDIVTKDRRERDLFEGQRLLKQAHGAGVDLPG